jgi:predicted NodU family carbamoyl transferase
VFSGFPLWDAEGLSRAAAALNAVRATVDAVAKIIVAGHIVGVARGRQEVGPRALGRRSFLGAPWSADGKDRMNRLKRRDSYRPVAPVLTLESVPSVFQFPEGIDILSPYMSFALPLQPWMEEVCPAVWHYDGTARPQTVRQRDDPWLHDLLQRVAELANSAEKNQGAQHDAVREEDGPSSQPFRRHVPPLLMNSSFNQHGRPMLNHAKAALEMLYAEEELGAVVVEEYLFTKTSVRDVERKELQKMLRALFSAETK